MRSVAKNTPSSAKRAGLGQERFRLIVRGDGKGAVATVQRDVHLLETTLETGDIVQHRLEGGRVAWLQLVKGHAEVNGERLAAGDGATFSDGEMVKIRALEPVDFVLFDMAEEV